MHKKDEFSYMLALSKKIKLTTIKKIKNLISEVEGGGSQDVTRWKKGLAKAAAEKAGEPRASGQIFTKRHLTTQSA